MTDDQTQATLTGSTVKDEKKFGDMVEVLAAIFTTPTVGLVGNPDTNRGLHFQATTERMIRLMKLADSDLTRKQTEEEVMKLTDAEKLTILSNASLKGPLGRDHFEEMQRLFFKVKGEEAYRMIFGDEDPPERPLHVSEYSMWRGK